MKKTAILFLATYFIGWTGGIVTFMSGTWLLLWLLAVAIVYWWVILPITAELQEAYDERNALDGQSSTQSDNRRDTHR